MTEITQVHAQWAVVDRLGQMLSEPPLGIHEVTQTYAHFSSVICWVLQHIRMRDERAHTPADKAAVNFRKKLERVHVTEEPWCLPRTERLMKLGGNSVTVPYPSEYSQQNVAQFLINLRNAIAHSGARNVQPFNRNGNLLGFTFHCTQLDEKDRRNIVWEGDIVLLRSDMQRIGSFLAQAYCVSQLPPDAECAQNFIFEARSVSERAA